MQWDLMQRDTIQKKAFLMNLNKSFVPKMCPHIIIILCGRTETNTDVYILDEY